MSEWIVLQETTPKEQMCFLTQQETATLDREWKESRVGHSFLLGFPSPDSFVYVEKQHHRERG